MKSYLVEVAHNGTTIKRRIAEDINAIYDYVEANAQHWANTREIYDELIVEDCFDHIDIVSSKTGEVVFVVHFKCIAKI